MSAIRKFEDIKAWQEGRALVRAIYAQTGKGAFSRDFGFKDQIQRAAVSICSNIAEGFETDSHAEFVRYLGYAKGSAGEVLSQLINAHDVGYVDDERFDELSEKTRFIGMLISRLRRSIVEHGLIGKCSQARVSVPRTTAT